MKKIIYLILICSMLCCACGKQESNIKVKSNNTSTSFEWINVFALSDDEVNVSQGSIDISNERTTLEKLTERADRIFKGELIKLDSNVNEQTLTVYTDYTFKISKVYKGDIEEECTINALGGIMKFSDYIAQMIEYEAVEEDRYSQDKDSYVTFGYEGFETLSSEGEYIIYASYNNVKNCYYSTGYFYGIFNGSDASEYVRHTMTDDGVDATATISEIENCIN